MKSMALTQMNTIAVEINPRRLAGILSGKLMSISHC